MRARHGDHLSYRRNTQNGAAILTITAPLTFSNTDYQRSRLPPPPLRPPPPPPPNPPPPVRGSWGRASFTVKVRPPISAPLRAVMAACASASEDISTKPKPRDWPLNLSVMIRAEATAPCFPNRSLNSCSVAE